ncbi:M50 family metallopeptidase [Streptomyces sp. NPDC060011]|uniref:M50 family metallopeptidase n=1 Tax=unclassified Streptomyces TaxID=2593676 RepID=UPI0013BA5A78|nr:MULTISPECIES: M50 family metallopeptidase [unclassified Streptomyces]MCX4916914.1 M50 family metallopeptidase [Streptomyces sp. NBC_00687]MCX5279005.1 M50 family metallopeptidase [Streptomyces sp. NBC_00198]NEB30930.1 M50 family metallopeptidase [Streptomyces sp. SID14446]WSD77669.1 M50 family metallopeptidase [Streptomyces sp. NBC_01558]WSK61262.1 M50 family metallopeptidase [Streptomyces sp. NBC_01281]
MDSTASTSLASLSTLWDEVFGSQPDPDLWVVIATLVAALAAVVPHGVWRLSRNAVTIAHEGGHGLVALLTGRSLSGIRLHSDTSGLTVSRGKPTGLGMILTAAAGYTAPPLLGLGGAALLAAGHITLLLWLATALLIAMLVMIRNAYGALTVILAGGTFVLVSWLTGPQVQAAFAYAVVWFLLLGGVRPAFELQAKRMRGNAGDSDADQLSRLTHVPAGLWLFLFHAVSLCSLMGGARWLLEV